MQQRERLEPPAVTPLERQLLVNAQEQKRPNIQPMPQSSVLSKLKSFLPQMQQANAELQQKLQSCDPSELDIEHISEGDGEQIIQMDLACGLLELRDDAAVAAAQRAIAAGGEVAVENYNGADSSDDDSDSDSSSSGDEAAAGPGSPSESVEDTADDAENTGQQSGSTAADAAGTSEQQQQQRHAANEQQQEQGRGSRRRKLKAKRPMIVELQSS